MKDENYRAGNVKPNLTVLDEGIAPALKELYYPPTELPLDGLLFTIYASCLLPRPIESLSNNLRCLIMPNC